MNFEEVRESIARDIISRYAPELTPADARDMAAAAIDVLKARVDRHERLKIIAAQIADEDAALLSRLAE
jgi:hypothetical protein